MRLRYAVLLPLALHLAPGAAWAQGGINLSWDDCGTSGTEVKVFSCNTNSGFHSLYVSAVAPTPMPQLNGVEIVIDLQTSEPALTDWWRMQIGGCRAASIVGNFNFTSGPYACYDIWGGVAAGGVHYASEFGGPNRARLRGVAAIAGGTAADDVTEMYLFAFQISNQKTVGAGSCAGCSDRACFLLSAVKLTQPVGVGDYLLSQALDRQVASWECPGFWSMHGGGGCTFNCPTPARKPSWGVIKSLYR